MVVASTSVVWLLAPLSSLLLLCTSTSGFSVSLVQGAGGRSPSLSTTSSQAGATAAVAVAAAVRITILNARPASKWDNIQDLEDDDNYDFDDDDHDEAFPDYTHTSPDMTYEPRNVKRQHETFLAIRGAGGKEVTNDLYVRVPSEDVFWYAGKVARVSDVSLKDCVARQWAMIERHACNLRPIELFPHRGTIQIWTAPGDSELEVAYNRPTLQMTRMFPPPRVLTTKDVKTSQVGFQGEVYQDGESGFRTWRTEDGFPARPEINAGGETRPPTSEEYAQIQKELAGKDMNALYEEQERRKQEGLL